MEQISEMDNLTDQEIEQWLQWEYEEKIAIEQEYTVEWYSCVCQDKLKI